jgi:hypothetical protein
VTTEVYLTTAVNYALKIFITFITDVNVIKPFISLTVGENKLECLFLVSSFVGAASLVRNAVSQNYYRGVISQKNPS